jgi:hypothetical protein
VTSLFQAAFTDVFQVARAAVQAPIVAKAVPAAVFAAVTALRAPVAWLSSWVRVAVNPAGNLVHVAVCRTPSFLSTWYVPLANTLIVGAALPAVMLAPPAAVAVQVGGVMFAAVSPYEPLGGTRV